MHLPKETHQKIQELWRDHSTKEIADLLGLKKNTVVQYGYRNLGGAATKSPNVKNKIKEMQRQWTLSLNSSPQIQTKKSKTIQKNIRMDKFRMINGENPKYKLRYTPLSERHRRARRRLCKVYNYFYFDDDPYTLYYDKDTNRNLKKRQGEDYYTQKYSFKFTEADKN